MGFGLMVDTSGMSADVITTDVLGNQFSLMVGIQAVAGQSVLNFLAHQLMRHTVEVALHLDVIIQPYLTPPHVCHFIITRRQWLELDPPQFIGQENVKLFHDKEN